MIVKACKIFIKSFITLLFIPYSIIVGLLIIITIFLPEKVIGRISRFFSYIGWTMCSYNLKLSGKIEVDYDQLNDSCILISNHIGSLDFILLHEIARANGMLWYMKYIIKKEAINIPVFGYLMDKINFVFVKRNFDKDKDTLIEHCREIKKNNQKVWFVVYPEGTRFTQEKQMKSKEFAQSRNLIYFNNLLMPRGKGLNVIIDNLRESHVSHLLDVTLYYRNKVPSLFYFLFFVTDADIKINARKININEINDVNTFLLDTFSRKDNLIEEWKNDKKNN